MSMTDTVETELLPLNEIRRTDDDEALRNDPHLIYLGHSWNFEEMLFYACLCFIVQIMGFTLFRTYLATHFTAYNVVLNEHCSAALSALCPSSNVACAGYWETKFFYWKRLNASDAQLVIPERYNVRVLGAKDDVCKTLGL